MRSKGTRSVRDAIAGALLASILAAPTAAEPSTMEEKNADPQAQLETRARELLQHYDAAIRPLEIELSLAWWRANTTGKDEDFAAKEAAQNRLDLALSDAGRFADLKAIRERARAEPGALSKLAARGIEILYLQALEKQVDPDLLRKLSALSNSVEKAFNVYRARVDGRELADSEVRRALKESKDSAYRKAVWEGSKGVGSLVEAQLRELVKLRNESARKLGFEDYHAMQLGLAEQSRDEVLRIFDELEALSREPFRKVKAEIDARIARELKIGVADLRPWHYHDPFFQEAPAVYDVDLDAAYRDQDLLDLARRFYQGIGLPVDDILARSDLYERQGKNPHAFCTDIDRAGDVRVLANVVPNEYWMGTLLHELGHGVYSSKNIPAELPYVLRTEAHTLATEAIAILFEKFSKRAGWLRALGVEVPDPAAFDATGRKLERDRLLIFAAWSQVMFRFEAAMYQDPDRDLSKLWWDLVERYQEVRRPEGRNAPDYAAKIHVVTAPAYYHNYLLGELFASQLHRKIARDVLGQDPRTAIYNGRPEVGAFLKERVFAPGRSLAWGELVRHATGEDLNPKAFAEAIAVP
ncbi:MAG: M2 family metallopeptidase [Planctomycetota bacterium]